MVKKIKGYKLIKQFPESESIVSMLEFKGRIFIATSKQVYELVGDDLLEPIKIKKELHDGS